jgi:GTP-binding protein HflX
LDVLLRRCEELAIDNLVPAELFIPHHRYDVVAKLHTVGHVKTQESLDDGVKIIGRFPQKFSTLYTPFIVIAAPKKKSATKRARPTAG